MSPTTWAVIVFGAMWALFLFGGFHLYRWLIRHDRQAEEGEAPFDLGL